VPILPSGASKLLRTLLPKPPPPPPPPPAVKPAAPKLSQVKDGFDRAPLRSAVNALKSAVKDAFVPQPLKTATPPVAPQGTQAMERLNGVNTDPAYREALTTQQQLSQTRQEAGRIQGELDNRNIFTKAWEGLTGADDGREQQVAQLQQQITALEQVERSQPAEAVERARFTVFNERMATLERERGPGAAATIARQTYYNSLPWNVGGGTTRASDAEILSAGLPHAPDYQDSLAVGGYGGRMRTPDGTVVDMGHVAAALDWQVNASRIPNTLPIGGDPWGNGGIPNPFTLDTVTLTGDVASAIRNTAAGDNVPERATAAINAEGDEDWNGDIDGLNLAHRLQQNPSQGIAGALNSYYGTGQDQNRIDEYATHSRYIQRDGDGVPQRDAQGHYVVDRERLAREAHAFSIILDPRALNNPSGEVVDAWSRWLNNQGG
jgi:hypothetical protein